MQFLESNAPAIMDAILAGRSKAVVDRAGFVDGTNEVVEGFLKIMKSIGAVPSSTPPVDPVVITPAVITATQAVQVPAPSPAPQSFAGTVTGLEVAKSNSPLDLASLLEQAAAQLRAR